MNEEPALVRVVDQVRDAAASGRALDIRGGASKAFYGGALVGEPLDLRPLSGVSSYEPTELVVTVRAGTRLSELEVLLEAHGQCLPFEPPRYSPSSTVGGMVAAGLAGPARANVGSVRDHVLGMNVVNGRGELLTFGGQVAKNVAGYDVSRLMVGALGILGVICDVSLKVLPTPVASATMTFELPEVEALRRLREWAAKPLPISASAWHEGMLALRLSGAKAAVDDACSQLSGSVRNADESREFWASIRDQQHPFFVLSEQDLAAGECLWRCSLPPNSAPIAIPGQQFIEWHGAQRWWRSRAPTADIRRSALAKGGHATLVRGKDKSAGVFMPLNSNLMTLHRALKQAFDPKRLFNRGRMYAEL
ncbi:MAG TPA: glycolate oxidase subunit GlcE [Steroidobacteraceae bacterium]|jgi:FAD/FMN-containing dehydrogenase